MEARKPDSPLRFAVSNCRKERQGIGSSANIAAEHHRAETAMTQDAPSGASDGNVNTDEQQTDHDSHDAGLNHEQSCEKLLDTNAGTATAASENDDADANVNSDNQDWDQDDDALYAADTISWALLPDHGENLFYPSFDDPFDPDTWESPVTRGILRRARSLGDDARADVKRQLDVYRTRLESSDPFRRRFGTISLAKVDWETKAAEYHRRSVYKTDAMVRQCREGYYPRMVVTANARDNRTARLEVKRERQQHAKWKVRVASPLRSTLSMED